jgi:hypothetical protein
MFPVQRCPVKPGRWTPTVPRGTSPLHRLATGWTEEHGTPATNGRHTSRRLCSEHTCRSTYPVRRPRPGRQSPFHVEHPDGGREGPSPAFHVEHPGGSGNLGLPPWWTDVSWARRVTRLLAGQSADLPSLSSSGTPGVRSNHSRREAPRSVAPPPTWSRRGRGGAVTAMSNHSLTPPPPRPVIGGSEPPSTSLGGFMAPPTSHHGRRMTRPGQATTTTPGRCRLGAAPADPGVGFGPVAFPALVVLDSDT